VNKFIVKNQNYTPTIEKFHKKSSKYEIQELEYLKELSSVSTIIKTVGDKEKDFTNKNVMEKQMEFIEDFSNAYNELLEKGSGMGVSQLKEENPYVIKNKAMLKKKRSELMNKIKPFK